jgi:AraC-like DNA-binding protein
MGLETKAKLKGVAVTHLLNEVKFLLISAMIKNQVTCSLITEVKNKPSFVWHEKVGCFESDWHQHPKGQLMYAENGCIHVNLEGKQWLLPSWYGAWVPAGTHHSIWSNSPGLLIRTVFFDDPTQHREVFSQPCVFPVSDLLKAMLRYTERWHQVAAVDAAESTFLLAMQHILPDEMTRSASVCLPSTTHPQLSALLEHLQKWTLESLARAFGFSPRTLTRLFSKHTGISFSRYGKIARVIKALELIERGEGNVSELADQVGYESISTFSNTFLEICGNRPLYFIHQKRAVV